MKHKTLYISLKFTTYFWLKKSGRLELFKEMSMMNKKRDSRRASHLYGKDQSK